jgi:zinc transport system substrate-binding protein
MITPMTRSLAAATLVAGTLLAAGCSGETETTTSSGESSSSGTPVVHVVNYPLMYFADRIAGDAADVRFAAPGDGDPAFWEPTREDIAAMQSADRVLLNGASYAKWLPGVSLPESRLVDTSASMSDQYIEIESAETHSHGGAGDHSHAGTAFTTWMDMRMARAQATAVRDAMLALAPDAADAIRANAEALMADIDALDAELAAAAAEVGDRPLVASHPVYQYFARRYGLSIEAVLWEPEVVPDDAAMTALGTLLAGHPATVMIWEGDPAAESVAMLEAIGVRSVVIDPCGNRPDGGDWLSVMQGNVAALRSIAGDA